MAGKKTQLQISLTTHWNLLAKKSKNDKKPTKKTLVWSQRNQKKDKFSKSKMFPSRRQKIVEGGKKHD